MKIEEQMKCVKKPVCEECPFRAQSIPGWLGPDSAREVLQKVHGEGGYVCHMSIDGKPKDSSGHVDVTKYGHQCIGAIIHANLSCKRYRDPQKQKLQEAVKGMEGGILNLPEFLEHHERKRVK